MAKASLQGQGIQACYYKARIDLIIVTILTIVKISPILSIEVSHVKSPCYLHLNGAHVAMGQNLEAIIMPTYTFLFQIQAENLLNQPPDLSHCMILHFFFASYHVLNYTQGIH